jgi:hypothetical protein
MSLQPEKKSCYMNCSRFRRMSNNMPVRLVVTLLKPKKAGKYCFTNINFWWERKLHYTPGQNLRTPGVCLPDFLNVWHMKMANMPAIRTVAFIPKEISHALFCVRVCVDPSFTGRPERINQSIFPVIQPEFELAAFLFEMQCPNQIRYSVPPLNCV